MVSSQAALTRAHICFCALRCYTICLHMLSCKHYIASDALTWSKSVPALHTQALLQAPHVPPAALWPTVLGLLTQRCRPAGPRSGRCACCCASAAAPGPGSCSSTHAQRWMFTATACIACTAVSSTEQCRGTAFARHNASRFW